MRIPAKAPLYIVTLHGPVSWNDIFDGRGQQVPIMKQAGGKWSILERVRFLSLGEFELALERPNFVPSLQQTDFRRLGLL